MKRLVIVLSVFLLLTAPGARASNDRALAGLVIAGNVADLVTTELAIRSGRGQEANPLGPHPTTRLIVKGAATSLEVTAVHYCWTHGHKRAAWILAAVLGAANASIAAHNVLVVRSA